MLIFNRDRFSTSGNYITYQEQVTNQHLLPLFRELRVPLDRPILDAGCGTGGCAIALATALSVPVFGVDLQEERISIARETGVTANVPVHFKVADILQDVLPGGTYGLIMMRDVVEHVPDLQKVLERLRPLLDGDGLLYISFPPWRGPYAGHQHNAMSIVRLMPYLHAVTPSLFLKLLHRWESTRKEWLSDENQIVATRLTMRKFERVARQCKWKIKYKKTYFLRPAFLRMGLPKVSNGWFGQLPGIGECLTTGCEYLLAPG